MKALRVRLLGSFELSTATGKLVELSGEKERALLAILALSVGHPLSRDRLAGLLWSDRGNAQARDSLKHALAAVRQAFSTSGSAVIAGDRSAVLLDATEIAVDVAEFEARLGSKTAEDDEAALALFRGEFLDGIRVQDPAFEDWVRIERARLHGLAETAASRRLDRAVNSGQPDAIIAAAEGMLKLDAYREIACRALMRAWGDRGETARALGTYAELRDRLWRDLGITPEPETSGLAEALRTRRHAAASRSGAARASAARPSIAVLPFRNASGDPDQAHLADGIAEDLIMALSHYRWFTVVSRNSSFMFRETSGGTREIAQALGVRYLLDGSVRRIGSRIRLSGHLIDAETDAALWAAHYERGIEELFAIQDDLTQQVVGAIEPQLLIGEGNRAQARILTSPDAYDCHMRGFWHHNQQDRAEDFANAIDWQRRAIQLDPGFARPYMALARSLYARCLFGHSHDIELDAKECVIAAERAVALDSRDAYSHYAMCLAHLLSGRPTEALAASEHAIEINPSLALAHNAVGWARIFVGRAADAIDPLTTAMRLSPQDSLTYLFLSRIGLAHYHLRNFAESVRFSERALSLRRRHFIMVVLLAGLGQIGRVEEARALAPALEAMTPPDRHRYWRMITLYLNPADRDLLFDGLRKAGILVDDYGR